MEWVEITAKTVEEARELALDQLGVDEQDAEIEVRRGAQGRVSSGKLRGQARVRARVRPPRSAQGRAPRAGAGARTTPAAERR